MAWLQQSGSVGQFCGRAKEGSETERVGRVYSNLVVGFLEANYDCGILFSLATVLAGCVCALQRRLRSCFFGKQSNHAIFFVPYAAFATQFSKPST